MNIEMSDTKTQTQAEPTMEEILASIRRIISENDEEQEAKKRAEAEAAAQLATSSPKSAPSNVLELTEMVTEDGSVVSLSAAGEQKQDVDNDVQNEAIAAAPETVPDREGGPTDEQADKAEIIMDSPKDDSVEFAPSTPSNATPADSPPSSAKDDGLVSAATAAAATATFAQLARTLAQEPTNVSGGMPLGSGRTLEDLVKEMIRPMLKEWLDANLAKIVDQAVRRELDRMTRRAENL